MLDWLRYRRPLNLERLAREFGHDSPEDRKVTGVLGEAVAAARGGRWDEAVPMFQRVAREHPDHDAPYLWLSDGLVRDGQPGAAVKLLKRAARMCRRKSGLLAQAGELALLRETDPRGAIRLLFQSVIAGQGKPRAPELPRQRACLLLKELFRAADDAPGVVWAQNMQDFTVLAGDMVSRVWARVEQLGRRERLVLARELVAIRKELQRRFPEESG